ncbi:cytidylyltransferase domain-containing protein [Lysinibacillus antri]|uniref:Acylneuraminate cytidylyltransferase n=1 Tax=Lysinibacillus antri TaxID=2498145 RepID=A0A3S0RWJ5_9BACI|nr:glycosyltransferase family protein [Lysinibacillus antri]RUL54192.1 acylneuraminate cytidylyltransferase [Lysinibacillus antri]
MRIVAIIQARMGSTRLPGKILKEVNGRPLLSYQLERLQSSQLIDEIVIATTIEKQDDIIEAYCNRNGISNYRGPEFDVLARYYEAAVKFHADIIVRITSDCPLIDPLIVDKTIQYFIDHQGDDYVSNTIDRTYPRGLDTEVFSSIALEQAYNEAFLERDREHVTAFFYTNKEKFKIGSVQNDIDYSKNRWTVDTEEDFELIKLLIEHLYKKNPTFTMLDAINVMEQNPDWYNINAHVEQKKI